MPHITEPELQSLHTLLWMEASMYEKFHAYRHQAQDESTRKLCDQLADRSRQHITAINNILSDANAAEQGDTYANE